MRETTFTCGNCEDEFTAPEWCDPNNIICFDCAMAECV